MNLYIKSILKFFSSSTLLVVFSMGCKHESKHTKEVDGVNTEEVDGVNTEEVDGINNEELGYWLSERTTSVGQVAVSCFKIEKKRLQYCYFTNRGTTLRGTASIERISEQTRKIVWESPECKNDAETYKIEKREDGSMNLLIDSKCVSIAEPTLSKYSDEGPCYSISQSSCAFD